MVERQVEGLEPSTLLPQRARGKPNWTKNMC